MIFTRYYNEEPSLIFVLSILRRVSCLAAEKARKQNGGENVFVSGRGGKVFYCNRCTLATMNVTAGSTFIAEDMLQTRRG